MCPLVDSSEFGPQGVGDLIGGTCQVIPNDQAQHLSTFGRSVKFTNYARGDNIQGDDVSGLEKLIFGEGNDGHSVAFL